MYSPRYEASSQRKLPTGTFFLETLFKICKDSSKTHGSEKGSQFLSYLIFTICSKFGGFEFCRVITFFEFLLVSSLVVVVKVPRKCLVNIRFFVLKTSFFHLHSSWKTACQNPRFEVKNTSNLRAWQYYLLEIRFSIKPSSEKHQDMFQSVKQLLALTTVHPPKKPCPRPDQTIFSLKCVINQSLDCKLGLQI